MLKFIRAIIRTIVGTGSRSYTADGRPDEKLAGKLYQHYGFRSSPPDGVELVHLEQGNNGFSVAENDGEIISITPAVVSGDVAIYSAHESNLNIITLRDKTLNISGQSKIFITVRNSDGQVVIGRQDTGDDPVSNLLTINFFNDNYILHTHGTVAQPTVPITGPPISINPVALPTRPWWTFFTGAN